MLKTKSSFLVNLLIIYQDITIFISWHYYFNIRHYNTRKYLKYNIKTDLYFSVWWCFLQAAGKAGQCSCVQLHATKTASKYICGDVKHVTRCNEFSPSCLSYLLSVQGDQWKLKVTLCEASLHFVTNTAICALGYSHFINSHLKKSILEHNICNM